MKHKYSSFLIINPYGIGDILFSTPLLRRLHELYPEAHINYLCNRRAASILEQNPLVNKLFIYDRDEFEAIKNKSYLQWLKHMFLFLYSLQKEHIDMVFDLSMASHFGMFAWLAGIRRRAGFNYRRRGRFLTDKLKIGGFLGKHVIDYYMSLLQFVGDIPKSQMYKMELYVSKEDDEWAEQLCQNIEISNSHYLVGIAPCGGESFGKDAQVKRWPLEQFAELINRLMDEHDIRVFLLAGPKEKEEIDRLLSLLHTPQNTIDASSFSVMRMAALVKRCQLVIANDTGPLRFANAFDKKIIALFGPVDDTVYGLYPECPDTQLVLKKDVPCGPCYRHPRLNECMNDLMCLKSITVDEVFKAVKKLLGNNISINKDK